MNRAYAFCSILIVLTVCGGGGCKEEPPEYLGLCSSVNPECPEGYVCKPWRCPDTYRCTRKRDGDRDSYPLGCVVDGFCDGESCETRWTCPDCQPGCDPALATSTPLEFLVSSYQSRLSQSPDLLMGVDLDGDGDVDSRWSQIANFVNDYTANDLDTEIAEDIAAGHLLIAARVFTDYPGDPEDLSLVQLLLAEVSDATPLFGGQDEVRLSPEASVDVGMCGRDSGQLYGKPEWSEPLRFPVPWPGPGGTVLVDLYSYYVEGEVNAAGWQEVHVGGGILPAQVYNELIPQLVEVISRAEGTEAETLAMLFDGNCVQLEDVLGCEAVVVGHGECDDSADPPVITWTEVACSPLLYSVLRPDFDSDGDGVPDLISFGARLTAVPATIVED